MLSVVGSALTREASMGKKWPLLPLSATTDDNGVVREEPGRCVGLTISSVLATVECSRWLEADAVIPLDQ